MTDLNITFSPLLPWPLLAALALLAIVVLVLGAALGQRATILRAFGLALALAALTDPSLVREKRDPQKTVVAVVIDRSESQNFGARPAADRGSPQGAGERAREIRRCGNALRRRLQ